LDVVALPWSGRVFMTSGPSVEAPVLVLVTPDSVWLPRVADGWVEPPRLALSRFALSAVGAADVEPPLALPVLGAPELGAPELGAPELGAPELGAPDTAPMLPTPVSASVPEVAGAREPAAESMVACSRFSDEQAPSMAAVASRVSERMGPP
jgi:hypothetical protein